MWERWRVFLTLWLVLSAKAFPVPPQHDLPEDKYTEAMDELRKVIQAISGTEERIHLRVPLKDREAIVLIEIPKSAAVEPDPLALHLPRVNSNTLDAAAADTFAGDETEGNLLNNPLSETPAKQTMLDLAPLQSATFGSSGWRGMFIFWLTVLIVVLPAAVAAHKYRQKKERALDIEAAAGEAEQPQNEDDMDINDDKDNQETD